MHRHLAALLCSACLTLPAMAQEDPLRVGVLLGLTGPIESLAADMSKAAEIAAAEINDAGGILGRRRVEVVLADNTCVDASAARTAAERLVSAEDVSAIVGADCSGATVAVVGNVSVPNGVPTVSPASTTPALTGAAPGLFFRTAPSDARQGAVLAEAAHERGLSRIAITYTNNDYGIGLAQAFTEAFEALGGEVVLSAAHEDGRGDYAAEVGALAASGADALLVIGYVDQGGIGIVRAAVDTGAFERFVLADGMLHEALVEELGGALDGSFGTIPGAVTPGSERFDALAAENGLTGSGPYRGESYDAMALVALAAQAAGSTERGAIAESILDVANAPGEPILPGELDRAIEILSEGGEIDYVGATDVELTQEGDPAGRYREMEISGSELKLVSVR